MAKKYKILITSLFLVSTIIVAGIYFVNGNKTTYSDEMILEESVLFENNLKVFLTSVEKSVQTYNDSIVNNKHQDINNVVLINFFTKLISNDNYFKGAFITNQKINFIIYSENSSWVTTYDTLTTDTLSTWKRLDSKLEVKSEWTDTYSFFHRNINQKTLLEGLENNEYVWMTTTSELPDRRNLITLVFNIDVAGKEMMTGFIFSAKDISNSFLSVLKYNRPLISIITDGGKIITPLITDDSSSISLYWKLQENVSQIIGRWSQKHDNKSHNYSFEKNHRIYWTAVSDIEDHIGIDGFAITLSDEDLDNASKMQNMIYLIISGILLLITIILAVAFFAKRKKKIVLSQSIHFVSLSDQEIEKMISRGETEFVEFKSSLRYDYREQKVNKVLEDVILKSIAAFANAKGGTLIIGVNDDLEVIGLNNDFSTLKKQDADYFELHLRKLINNQYGIAFANEHLSVTFPLISGEIICVIRISPSNVPVFLKVRNKQGHEVEKFYVRSGNASQEIASLKEINEYTKRRFDN